MKYWKELEDDNNSVKGKDIKTLKKEAKANGYELFTNMNEDYIVDKK